MKCIKIWQESFTPGKESHGWTVHGKNKEKIFKLLLNTGGRRHVSVPWSQNFTSIAAKYTFQTQTPQMWEFWTRDLTWNLISLKLWSKTVKINKKKVSSSFSLLEDRQQVTNFWHGEWQTARYTFLQNKLHFKKWNLYRRQATYTEVTDLNIFSKWTTYLRVPKIQWNIKKNNTTIRKLTLKKD
jgi:hypothetical protein